jgi:proteic killer suppression protein
VLRSFWDKDTEAVWHRRRSRQLDPPLQRAAWRKLAMLDAADVLADLRVPPGNRLEKRRSGGPAGAAGQPAGEAGGDRAGQYSIRINQQWRVCFRWADAGPEDVEITDYH